MERLSLAGKLLDESTIELRIAKQPPQEQRTPRPARFDVNLITTINTSKKRICYYSEGALAKHRNTNR